MCSDLRVGWQSGVPERLMGQPRPGGELGSKMFFCVKPFFLGKLV